MANVPLRRSILATPANDPSMVRTAARSDADEVLLDLEDSLAPREKEPARGALAETIAERDWGEKRLSYRINDIRTQWWYADVIDVLDAAGDAVDDVVVPKVQSAFDVRVVANLLNSLAPNVNADIDSVGLVAQVETATGIANVEEIAAASERLNTLMFGPGDYIASLGGGAGVSVEESAYDGHYWHYPLSRISQAAASQDLLAVDGPYADHEDLDGFVRSCRHAKMLGFVGKITVHPKQIGPANDAFSLSADEVGWAERIVSTYERTDGVPRIEGKLVDSETYRMAKRLLTRAEKEERRS